LESPSYLSSKSSEKDNDYEDDYNFSFELSSKDQDFNLKND